jgi:two-component system, response regulator / RNA-binding antiterminator
MSDDTKLADAGLGIDRDIAMQHVVHCNIGARLDLDTRTFKIAVVDNNELRASVVLDGLREAGHGHVTWIRDMSGLMRQLYDLDPDVVVIDLENPSRDSLEQMFQISRAVRRPVAMFVDQSDRAAMEAALDAGVSAYVVDGLKKERISAILDMAIMRFNAVARLREELEHARTALEERKIIERAKGILMKQKHLDEPSAYALLRKTAMNRNSRMIDIAQSIITAAEIME